MEREDELKNRMIRLILPIAFQQFMLALVSACDVVMLGRLSQEAMSAVSLASQVTFVFNLFMAAFVIGENMFLAGSLLIPETIMRILTSEPELVRLGSAYLRYVGVSWLLSAVSQVYLAYMKNCGALTGVLLLALSPPLTAAVGKYVSIGDGTYANMNLTLIDDWKITIGKGVLFGPNVTLSTTGHPVHPKHRTDGMYSFPITIGNNVWIGANVIVLPGVTIGENSVIGAGSVVTKDIPANVVAFGSPCKVYREINERDEVYYFKDRRFDDQPE